MVRCWRACCVRRPACSTTSSGQNLDCFDWSVGPTEASEEDTDFWGYQWCAFGMDVARRLVLGLGASGHLGGGILVVPGGAVITLNASCSGVSVVCAPDGAERETLRNTYCQSTTVMQL